MRGWGRVLKRKRGSRERKGREGLYCEPPEEPAGRAQTGNRPSGDDIVSSLAALREGISMHGASRAPYDLIVPGQRRVEGQAKESKVQDEVGQASQPSRMTCGSLSASPD